MRQAARFSLLKSSQILVYGWLLIVIEIPSPITGITVGARQKAGQWILLSPGISTVYDELERVDGFKTITSVLPSMKISQIKYNVMS